MEITPEMEVGRGFSPALEPIATPSSIIGGVMRFSIFSYLRARKRFANHARLRKKPFVCPSIERR